MANMYRNRAFRAEGVAAPHVFIYFLGRQVTVPVEYRHLVSCGEKLARGVALKQKILVHKSFHSYLLPISR